MRDDIDDIARRCSRVQGYPWQSWEWSRWYSEVRNAVGIYDAEHASLIVALQPFSFYARILAPQVRPAPRPRGVVDLVACIECERVVPETDTEETEDGTVCRWCDEEARTVSPGSDPSERPPSTPETKA